jgi:dephospho-CoA kinase
MRDGDNTKKHIKNTIFRAKEEYYKINDVLKPLIENLFKLII